MSESYEGSMEFTPQMRALLWFLKDRESAQHMSHAEYVARLVTWRAERIIDREIGEPEDEPSP